MLNGGTLPGHARGRTTVDCPAENKLTVILVLDQSPPIVNCSAADWASGQFRLREIGDTGSGTTSQIWWATGHLHSALQSEQQVRSESGGERQR